MRWVFASVLAGVLAVGQFLGMGRLITDGEDRGYETVERYERPMVIQTPLPDWVFDTCRGCLKDGEPHLPLSPRPKMQSLSEQNDEVETAILNALQSHRVVAREGGRYWQDPEPDWPRFHIPRVNVFECSMISSHSCEISRAPKIEAPKFTGLSSTTCETSFLINGEGQPMDIQVQCLDERWNVSVAEGLLISRWDTENAACRNPCPYVGHDGERIYYPVEIRFED